MAADPGRLRFFVDETSLGVGKALAIVRTDVVHTGHPLIAGKVPCGAPDPEWMPVVAEMGLAVISRDRGIRAKHAKTLLHASFGLRVFWLAGRRDLTSWEATCRIVRRWDDIEHALDERGPGPWFMAVRGHDLAEMTIPGAGEHRLAPDL
jgi:hypothetical protein